MKELVTHIFLTISSLSQALPTVSVSVEKNNTLKKFVAGSSTQLAVCVWFAVPGETRATVRYIVFTRATVLTPPVKVTSLVSQGLPVVGGEGETGYTIRQQQSLGVVAFSAFLI